MAASWVREKTHVFFCAVSIFFSNFRNQFWSAHIFDFHNTFQHSSVEKFARKLRKLLQSTQKVVPSQK